MPATPFLTLPRVSRPLSVPWVISPAIPGARGRGWHTLGPDVCPPLSSYLEESPVGSSQDHLQVSTTSRPLPLLAPLLFVFCIHATFHVSRIKTHVSQPFVSHVLVSTHPQVSPIFPIIPSVFIPVFFVCLLPVRLVLSGLTSVFSHLPAFSFLFHSFPGSDHSACSEPSWHSVPA